MWRCYASIASPGDTCGWALADFAHVSTPVQDRQYLEGASLEELGMGVCCHLHICLTGEELLCI